MERVGGMIDVMNLDTQSFLPVGLCFFSIPVSVLCERYGMYLTVQGNSPYTAK